MSVLILVEHNNESVKQATLSCINAAKKLNSPIRCLVAGFQCQAVAKELQTIDAISEIYLADDECYQHALAESIVPLIQQLLADVTHVLAPATTFGKNILPRLAAKLDVGQVSDIVDVVDNHTYLRPIYAGNAIIQVESLDTVQVLTVRPTAFPPVETGSASQVPIKEISYKAVNQLSQFINMQTIAADRPELDTAEIVISGGRGLQNEQTFARLINIADRLGAAIGASRAAVDAGLAPNDWQVGQTGKVVAPKLYIAVGISGAIQHLAGMKDSRVIAAINKDPDAPIFQVANYGLVADLNQVLPEWEKVLTEMGY